MKRDMDLIRSLLIQIEEGSSTSLDAYTEEQNKQILYHKNLLIEAKLAHGMPLYGNDRLQKVIITDLTWEGHEFLDVVRDAVIWQKTKEKVEKELGGSTTIVIIKELAIAIAKTVVNTDGGSYIGGNVEAVGDFVGRDQSERSNNQN